MLEFWNRLGLGARFGLVGGAAAIILMTASLGWWLLRPDYQVLFSDLKPQDAAAMTAELDRLKIPYSFSDNGGAILVDQAVVHATRIKLMGKDIPLHGAVGLELFNNTDFGMTEFAQKINFQRAIQGELTRTILALAEVRDARVHLALPEQGLFRQASQRPKAAITVTLRPGQSLRGEQVTGIQRLVAAAVPGMVSQDVTIVDQRGVALSRPVLIDGDEAMNHTRLDLKREIEAYLARKANAVLERTFGAGVALASIDVTLNMDQIKVTTEDVIGVPGRGVPTGVIVRERESSRDASIAPLDPRPGLSHRGGNSAQREVDYQAGRRVEQLVGQPGSIRRIQAVAVIPGSLDDQRLAQLRRTLAAAVGASLERGDEVVIQFERAANAATAETEVMPSSMAANERSAQGTELPRSTTTLLAFGLMLALLFAGAGVAALLYRARASRAQRTLTEVERQAVLHRIRAWLEQGQDSMTAPTGGESPASRGGV